MKRRSLTAADVPGCGSIIGGEGTGRAIGNVSEAVGSSTGAAADAGEGAAAEPAVGAVAEPGPCCATAAAAAAETAAAASGGIMVEPLADACC